MNGALYSFKDTNTSTYIIKTAHTVYMYARDKLPLDMHLEQKNKTKIYVDAIFKYPSSSTPCDVQNVAKNSIAVVKIPLVLSANKIYKKKTKLSINIRRWKNNNGTII